MSTSSPFEKKERKRSQNTSSVPLITLEKSRWPWHVHFLTKKNFHSVKNHFLGEKSNNHVFKAISKFSPKRSSMQKTYFLHYSSSELKYFLHSLCWKNWSPKNLHFHFLACCGKSLIREHKSERKKNLVNMQCWVLTKCFWCKSLIYIPKNLTFLCFQNIMAVCHVIILSTLFVLIIHTLQKNGHTFY